MGNPHAEIQSLLVRTTEVQRAMWIALNGYARADSLLPPIHPTHIQNLLSGALRIRAVHNGTIGFLSMLHNLYCNRFLSLPFDVLSHIIKLACSPKTMDHDALTITHVCRRFRYVALNTVVLWSHLFSRDSLDKTTSFISRAKEADLSVTIEEISDASHLDNFLALVTPHCDRWVEFRYMPRCLSESWIRCSSDIGELQKRTIGWKLPRLRSLYVYSGPNELRTFKRDEPPTICSDWWTPALTRLTCWHGHPEFWRFKSVTSLAIYCERYQPDVQPCLVSLLEGLILLPHLEGLELTMINVPNEERTLPTTTLPTLKTMHLSVTESNYNANLQRFRSAFHLPSLEKLSLMVCTTGNPMEFPAILGCALFEPEQCPSVQDLHLYRHGTITGPSEPKLTISLDSFFQAFPNSRHISIGMCDINVSYESVQVPGSLKTLSIGCNKMEVSSVGRLLEKIKSDAAYADFEKMAVFCIEDADDADALKAYDDLRRTSEGTLIFGQDAMLCPLWAERFKAGLIDEGEEW